MARRACLAWLHHALKFSWFPESPGVSSLASTADNQIAFLGLSVAALQQETQSAIFQYLAAVSAGRTDEATETLLSLLRPGKNAAEFETVRDRFRQVVPFRDGGWDSVRGHESIAEHVFLQWRIATEAGYNAPEEYISFVRGFWGVALMSHRLAPEDDVLREAVNEIQLFDAFDKLRSLLTINNLAMQGQDWLRFLMEAPEQLNAIAARKRFDRPNACKKFAFDDSMASRRRPHFRNGFDRDSSHQGRGDWNSVDLAAHNWPCRICRRGVFFPCSFSRIPMSAIIRTERHLASLGVATIGAAASIGSSSFRK
jgi:hypothetical protein